MTCLIGGDADEFLPPPDPLSPEEEAAAIAAEHQRLADYVTRQQR